MYNNLLKTFMISAGIIVLDKEVKKKKENNLPSFKDLLEIKHYMPGRIRFYSNRIKNNKDTVIFLGEQLNKIPIIDLMDINIITGTVLIKYNANEMEPIVIISILIKLLNLEKEISKEPKDRIGTEIVEVKNSLNRAVYEKTQGILSMKTIMFFALLSYGIKRYRQRPDLIPGGVTLMYWALSYLNKIG
ncbi:MULTISPECIES: HMA2 domain-containing protein [unclassified Clostridium]|uniref:HMA2 domain-containing protein n=1 Tax=unclassified Clostridium TaxID=2614128 RepID=UPI003F8E0005